MTIHQAKGLEFPVVIIPDLSAAGGGAHNPVAVWDPRLGCVARPPAEEPPPFADFGWRLWEAGEAVEDWREELRTLYVACTRAQDYLILSAALPSNYSPQNTWMLALAERFDLRRGRCLDEGIPAEKRPQVRVTDLRAPPPEDLPYRSRDRQGAGSVSRSLTRAAPTTDRGDAARILLVGEVEALLRGATPLAHASGWDAEDGSDRSCWEPPRERVERFADSGLALRDRVIRAVMASWDFRHPEAWRLLLAQGIDVLPTPQAAQDALADLAEVLHRFAKAPVLRQLSRVAVCHRDWEYLLPLPPAPGLFALPGPLFVRGVLDCLWQDEEGAWHLLLYDTARGDSSGQGWETRLAFGVLAVREQFGRVPKTARSYRWEEGKVVSLRGGERRAEEILSALARALAPQPLFIGLDARPS
jgi:ATP-dependent exoDNAse (exonuclease V) beta subunit